MMEWLIGPLGAILGGAVVVIGWLADRTLQRRKGEQEGRNKAQTESRIKDHENAADIRRRALDADGVHPDDDIRGNRD